MPTTPTRRARWVLAAAALLVALGLTSRYAWRPPAPSVSQAPPPATASPAPVAPPAGRAQLGPALPAVLSWQDADRDIAARFAPEFHQGLIGRERFDYITNFDFDDDWNGDNNWDHAADTRYPMKAYVYYAVSETPTHYFVHYAVFHPRDWKGGEKTGRFLSGTIREGTTMGGTMRAPGVLDDLVLSHENDLEGCLVVAAKQGTGIDSAQVVLVETMAHNRYLRFAAEPGMKPVGPLRLDDQHPLLYVEAQGHGIEAFHDQPVRGVQTVGLANSDPVWSADAAEDSRGAQKKGGLLSKVKGVTKVKGLMGDRLRIDGKPTQLLAYRFSGTADDPEATSSETIGYDLVPLYTTFWKAASAGRNETFGEVVDYGTRSVSVVALDAANVIGVEARQVRLGSIGAGLRGEAGGENKARAPWGWFDRGERKRPRGEWFFDPAGTVLRHLGTSTPRWSTAYLHQPFLGVVRDRAIAVRASAEGVPVG